MKVLVKKKNQVCVQIYSRYTVIFPPFLKQKMEHYLTFAFTSTWQWSHWMTRWKVRGCWIILIRLSGKNGASFYVSEPVWSYTKSPQVANPSQTDKKIQWTFRLKPRAQMIALVSTLYTTGSSSNDPELPGVNTVRLKRHNVTPSKRLVWQW